MFANPYRYDAGTGWATFRKAFDPEHIHVVDGPGDLKHSAIRKEIIDVRSGMHLGYVYIDKRCAVLSSVAHEDECEQLI